MVYLSSIIAMFFMVWSTLFAENEATFSIQGCPDYIQQQFYDVSKGPGAGSDCSDMQPKLSVSCSPKTLTVESNAIPSFTMYNTTINPLREIDFKATITLNPTIAEKITPISDENGTPLLGYLGFTVTGIPIYGPTEAAIPPTQAYGSPIYNCIVAMGSNRFCAPGKTTRPGCGAHTGHLAYHYHFIEEACFQGAKSLVAKPWEIKVDPSKKSGIIGYAADGFPIYGRYEHKGGDKDAEVIQVHSSYFPVEGKTPETNAFKAYEYKEMDDPHQYLDECNGHTHDGSYHYHATDEFPYIIGCFKGTPEGVGKIRPNRNSFLTNTADKLSHLVGLVPPDRENLDEIACH